MREPLKDKNRLEHIINAIDIILMGTPIIHNPTHTRTAEGPDSPPLFVFPRNIS